MHRAEVWVGRDALDQEDAAAVRDAVRQVGQALAVSRRRRRHERPARRRPPARADVGPVVELDPARALDADDKCVARLAESEVAKARGGREERQVRDVLLDGERAARRVLGREQACRARPGRRLGLERERLARRQDVQLEQVEQGRRARRVAQVRRDIDR